MLQDNALNEEEIAKCPDELSNIKNPKQCSALSEALRKTKEEEEDKGSKALNETVEDVLEAKAPSPIYEGITSILASLGTVIDRQIFICGIINDVNV